MPIRWVFLIAGLAVALVCLGVVLLQRDITVPGVATLGLAVWGAFLGTQGAVRASHVQEQQRKDREPDIRLRARGDMIMQETIPFLPLDHAGPTHVDVPIVNVTASNHGRVRVQINQVWARYDCSPNPWIMVPHHKSARPPHDLEPGKDVTFFIAIESVADGFREKGISVDKVKARAFVADALGREYESDEFEIDLIDPEA